MSYPSLPGFNRGDWIRNYFDSLELRRAGKRSLRKPDQGKQAPWDMLGDRVKTWWLCARNRIMKREKKGLKTNDKFFLFFRIPLQTGLKTRPSHGSSTVYYFSQTIDCFFSPQLFGSCWSNRCCPCNGPQPQPRSTQKSQENLDPFLRQRQRRAAANHENEAAAARVSFIPL